jgi:predicted nucleotidyltransferase
MTPQSDIDLMVEFAPEARASLADLDALKEELQAPFENRRVDVTTPSIMRNPYRAASIERDRKVVYAA